MISISMQTMQKLAEGNTAEIFQLDNNRILKLFKPVYSKESMLHEYYNHQVVNGTNLTEWLLNEQTFEKAMEQFVFTHKAWNKEASAEAISYKDWMKAVVADKESNTELLEKINQLPDGDMLCHGDFHPYNIIVTAEDKPIVIDFANVCCGPGEYDLARTYYLIEEAGVKEIAECYLEKMQVDFDDIQMYYEVIRQLRNHELNTK